MDIYEAARLKRKAERAARAAALATEEPQVEHHFTEGHDGIERTIVVVGTPQAAPAAVYDVTRGASHYLGTVVAVEHLPGEQGSLGFIAEDRKAGLGPVRRSVRSAVRELVL